MSVSTGGDSFDELLEVLEGLSDEELESVVESLPPAFIETLLPIYAAGGSSITSKLIEFTGRLEEDFQRRPHLEYLADRISQAIEDVENGISRRILIQMPPRTGKTTLASQMTAAWSLARNPHWPIALTSHDGGLATAWGRQIRRWVEGGSLGEHVAIARDAGAASSWETTEGGKLLSISIRESFTGRGAKVLIIDDPHKDFVDAHSETMRDAVWDWWLSVAQTRLEPPSLVIVTMTRWHEDDFIGRLLSKDYPGDPDDWEVIRFPAIAEGDDVLGRSEGQPLYSPLLEETEEEALERWKGVRESVGEYVWSAMYQQRPAPSEGSIFKVQNFKYWTRDPSKVTEDGRIVLLPEEDLINGTWLDSWDCSFKGGDSADYVVGQRWVRVGAERILIDQQRGKWSFTETLPRMEEWSLGGGPYGSYVHQTLIEDKANGTAIIDVLRKKVSGLKPISPRDGKEVRARAITPEVESGHVRLPHPSEPGYSWVTDLLSEIRNFPHASNDDQVDSLTQALTGLRDGGLGGISTPSRTQARVTRNLARNATVSGRRTYSR